MADPNERVPTHDLSHEPQRSAFNAEGWTDVVDGQGTGAARLVEAKDSTSARVRALMETEGLSEQEASEQAINELDQRIEGKTADVETYIRLFAKEALTKEEVQANPYLRNTPDTQFSGRAILYPDRAGRGEFLLRYGTSDWRIKEVRIKPLNIASVNQAVEKQKVEAKGKGLWTNMDSMNVAYRHIKARLQELEFHFEKPGAGIEDTETEFDTNVSRAISQKGQIKEMQAVIEKRKKFDL